jgi:hypothetical protein
VAKRYAKEHVPPLEVDMLIEYSRLSAGDPPTEERATKIEIRLELLTILTEFTFSVNALEQSNLSKTLQNWSLYSEKF